MSAMPIFLKIENDFVRPGLGRAVDQKCKIVQRERMAIVLININYESFWEEPGGGPGIFKDFPEVAFDIEPFEALELWVFSVMKKIASFAVWAAAVFEETDAVLGLVPVVRLVVAAELVPTVCEFALVLVWAISVFDKFFAKLGFLLVPSREVLDESILGTLAGCALLAVLLSVVAISYSFHNLE